MNALVWYKRDLRIQGHGLRKRADDSQIAAMAARNRTPDDPRFNVKRPGRKIEALAKPASQLSFDL